MRVSFSSKQIGRGQIGRVFTQKEQPVLIVEQDSVSLRDQDARPVGNGHAWQLTQDAPPTGTHYAHPDEFYCIGSGDTAEDAIKQALYHEHLAKTILLEGCAARGWENVEIFSGIRKEVEVVPVSKPINPMLIGLPEGTPVDSGKFPNFYAQKIISLAAFEKATT